MPAHPILQAKVGVSPAGNEKQAAKELFDQIAQPDPAAVLFFCSPRYDRDKLGKALKAQFPGLLLGCTTAGEISPAGYHKETLTGVSLGTGSPGNGLKIHSRMIHPLSEFCEDRAQRLADSIKGDLVLSPDFDAKRMFGLMMIDGMSMLEESVAALLHEKLHGVSIIGGSAGDDLRFQNTYVYVDGRFLSGAALFVLVETALPFHVFMTQHFRPTERKMVVTDAIPDRRRVVEIDGDPAARAYADALGLDMAQLGPPMFSKYPFMLKIGGKYYVRSIQKMNADQSLTFYCAIDNGLVLTIGEGIDLVQNLQQQLLEIEHFVPSPRVILGCDCILRRLEAEEKGLSDKMQQVLRDHNFVGFSTYGEQYNGIHVNQTLTGVAIGGGE